MSHTDTNNTITAPIKKRRIRLSSVSETPAKICSKKAAAAEATAEEATSEANKNTCDKVVYSDGHSKITSCASNSVEIRYLYSLSAIERNVCLIAKEHLQSSFDLSRSSGFISWKRDNL
jgi:predicted Zn-dependent protease